MPYQYPTIKFCSTSGKLANRTVIGWTICKVTRTPSLLRVADTEHNLWLPLRKGFLQIDLNIPDQIERSVTYRFVYKGIQIKTGRLFIVRVGILVRPPNDVHKIAAYPHLIGRRYWQRPRKRVAPIRRVQASQRAKAIGKHGRKSFKPERSIGHFRQYLLRRHLTCHDYVSNSILTQYPDTPSTTESAANAAFQRGWALAVERKIRPRPPTTRSLTTCRPRQVHP